MVHLIRRALLMLPANLPLLPVTYPSATPCYPATLTPYRAAAAPLCLAFIYLAQRRAEVTASNLPTPSSGSSAGALRLVTVGTGSAASSSFPFALPRAANLRASCPSSSLPRPQRALYPLLGFPLYFVALVYPNLRPLAALLACCRALGNPLRALSACRIRYVDSAVVR